MSRKFEDLRDWAVLTRLDRIVQAGGLLSEGGQEVHAKLLAKFPEFERRTDDRNDFDSWIGGGRLTGPRGDVTLVKDVPLGELVPAALQIEAERQWEQGDLWSNLCREEPYRAIAAIAEAPLEHRWAMNAWRPLLDMLSMTVDRSIAPKILSLLLEAPPDFIGEASEFIARWLERQRANVTSELDHLQWAFALWDRVADAVYIDGLDDEKKGKAVRDPVGRAAGDPGGVLAEFLVRVLSEREPAKDTGWPDDLRARAIRAAQCIGPEGLLARVVFAMRLSFLDYIDHDWVIQYLVPSFDWAGEKARPLWRARAYDSHPGLPRLFNPLKGSLLQVLRRPDLDHPEASNLIGCLLRAYLYREVPGEANYEIGALEIRRMLAEAAPETRHATAWVLWRWMSPQTMENGEVLNPDRMWRDGYRALFREVWPMEPGLRDERTSQDLTRMVLTLDECLADAVDTVRGFIVPFYIFDIGITFGLDNNPQIVETHPGPTLDLLNAAVDSRFHPVPRDLMEKLERIAAADLTLTELPAYNRLVGEWRRRQARG